MGVGAEQDVRAGLRDPGAGNEGDRRAADHALGTRQLGLAPLEEKPTAGPVLVLGTPTLFIDGVVHRGGYDPPTLLAALAGPLPAEKAAGPFTFPRRPQ